MNWSFVLSVLNSLAPYAAPALASLFGAMLIKLYSKLPAKQRTILANLVGTAVAAVEQKSPAAGLSPEEKKAMALSFIHAQLAHFNLSVPDSVIEPMLEESVLALDLAMGKNIVVPTSKAGAK